MKKHRSFIALLFFALSVPLLAMTTYKPDFGSKAGIATPDGHFISPDKVVLNHLADGTPCLELKRGAMQPRVALEKEIGDNEDYGYSLTYTRQQEDSAACFGFKTSVEEYSALLFVNPQGNVLIHNGTAYEATGLRVKEGVPTRLNVSVSRQSGRIAVRVGESAPYECDAVMLSGLKFFAFSQQPPDGNISFVSDFELHHGVAKVLTRQNIAPESTVVLNPNPTLANVTASLVDSDTEQEITLPEKFELLFALPQPATITAVQIFGGRPGVAHYPSGACSPKHFVVDGFADGAWKQLAEVTDAPELCLNDALAPAEIFTLTEVEPTMVEQVRIRFLASHDTGDRLTGRLTDESLRSTSLREIQLFTDMTVAPPLNIRKLVKVDWRLPFYRNAEKAELYMEVGEAEEQVPDAVHMKILAPDGTTVMREEDIPIRTGVVRYMLEGIGDWEPGRYVTELTLPGSAVRLRRLLRLEHVPEVVPAVEPMQMSAGKKLFFTPDDYLLAECHNLAVKVFPADACHLQAQTPDDPGRLISSGDEFYATQDGRYALRVVDKPFRNGRNINRWLVSDSPRGPFVELPAGGKPAARKPEAPIFKDFRKFGGYRPAEGTKYEVFDPAVHGELDLSTLAFYYIYGPTDFGCLKTSKTALWLLGRTKEGKWVLPRNTALFEACSSFSDEVLDDGMTCNDNFGGFWLSEDGKTLYLAQGQTLRRCAPFVVPYDNFQLGIRMMTVYSSQDGINWKYENTLVPTEEDGTFGAQHYGSMRLPLAQGDLVLVYLYAYDSDYQQIYIELAYSRDNLHFHRFPGAPAFARGADPSSWYYGHVFANTNIVQEGTKFFQQVGYCTPLPHFIHESYSRHNSLAEVEAKDFENSFKRRTLAERWPFFKSIGGYEGLAEFTRNGYYSTGAMEFRAFGWFGLEAGLGEGHFTTRRMSGGRRLTANVTCGPGGYLEVEAVDAATGARLAVGRVDGDGLAEPLFTLPEGTGEFFLRARMANARLYTLDFAE